MLLPRCALAMLFALLALTSRSYAMERVTLNTGFTFLCIRHEPIGAHLRLYFEPTTPGAGTNYLDVAAVSVTDVETLPDPPAPPPTKILAATIAMVIEPTALELTEMLEHAGIAHNIDAALLASVVHAESGGHTRAISRTGAQGLMQLMPGTASAVGVQDTFIAAQNVEGGTRYLDQMLTRYHNNIALALAAYNAGPAAVDRYRGVPPFRETRLYVARVIREFNARKTILLARAK